MKKKNKYSKKEIMIKLVAITCLFMLLILSFFFSSRIEDALGLTVKYSLNDVDENVINTSDSIVTYLDVGQGNCSIIKFPDGKILIIDGGSLDNGAKIVEHLDNMGVESIDYMIATHADSDHIGGLLTVLDNYDVKNIFRPFQIAGSGSSADTFVPDKDENLAEVYNQMIINYGNKSKISRITSYEYISFISKIYHESFYDDGLYKFANVMVFYDELFISGDGYSIEFFAPLKRDEEFDLSEYSNTSGYATIGYGAENSNGNSAIFVVTINDSKFLFTGDAPWSDSNVGKNEKFEELDFVDSLTDKEKEELSSISVYLVGHHGSKYSSSDKLLDLINPIYNVVSVGKGNSYGFPRYETINRINNHKITEDNLLLTSECGNISFGFVDNKLVYCLEKTIKQEKLTISWYMLGTIIFVLISYTIISIKVKKQPS